MVKTATLKTQNDGLSQHEGRWLETSAGILYVVQDVVQFDDDFSHFRSGFCRLLEMSEEQAKNFIASAVRISQESQGLLLSELDGEQKVEVLKKTVLQFFSFPDQSKVDSSVFPESIGTTYDGSRPNHIYANSISGNTDRLVIGNQQKEFAWQVSAGDLAPVAAASVVYDQSYYDSPQSPHCGMRDYVRDDDWRMEKARRLMRTVLQGAGARSQRWSKHPANVVALDVGSALGYYRKAMHELGFRHHGIDLSQDAIRLCQERFGYETWTATVFDLPAVAPQLQGSCDVITLWDTIEHLDDPLAAIKLLYGFLCPQGVLVVRTPSLTAFEAAILRDMYYSFKLDHIRYFSPQSLSALMKMAGLQPLYIETTSHLFKGVLGANYLYQMDKQLHGADIVALYCHD